MASKSSLKKEFEQKDIVEEVVEEVKDQSDDVKTTEEQPKKETKEEAQEKNKEYREKELIDTLQRLQAEFENYKKRIEREKNETRQYAEQLLIEDLLPLLDNFELALKNTKNHEEFIKGVELIYSGLFTVLQEHGLKKIPQKEKFDPYYHEALLTESSELPENTIIEELQPGYMLNERVIRTAKVKISKKEKM